MSMTKEEAQAVLGIARTLGRRPEVHDDAQLATDVLTLVRGATVALGTAGALGVPELLSQADALGAASREDSTAPTAYTRSGMVSLTFVWDDGITSVSYVVDADDTALYLDPDEWPGFALGVFAADSAEGFGYIESEFQDRKSPAGWVSRCSPGRSVSFVAARQVP